MIRCATGRPSAAFTTFPGSSSKANGRICSRPSSCRRRSAAWWRRAPSTAARVTFTGDPARATTSGGSGRRSRALANATRWARASSVDVVARPIAVSSARLVSGPTTCRSPFMSHHSPATPAAAASRSSTSGSTPRCGRRGAIVAASARTTTERGATTVGSAPVGDELADAAAHPESRAVSMRLCQTQPSRGSGQRTVTGTSPALSATATRSAPTPPAPLS